MALQLVYTSAPRLLAAGRSGFGTVAKHQEVPQWLQDEIERLSQFSRTDGLDPSRTILRHLILGSGTRRHHVISRIKDAGADYTGRTNHIAHHIILTSEEAGIASSRKVTPADLIQHLTNHSKWHDSWEAPPTILGPEDAIPIDSIGKSFSLPPTAWPDITGSTESAAILAPSKTTEKCWIIHPDGWSEALIYLYGESLLLHSDPWAISFTNALQPTDDQELIQWRGLPPDSPLRDAATQSVRPTLDLTQPSSLPPPVPAFCHLASTGTNPKPAPPPPKKPNDFLHPTTRLATQPSTQPSPYTSTLSSSHPTPPPPSRLPHTTRTKPNRILPLTLATLTALLLATSAGLYIFLHFHKKQKDQELITQLITDINNRWSRLTPSPTQEPLPLYDLTSDDLKNHILPVIEAFALERDLLKTDPSEIEKKIDNLLGKSYFNKTKPLLNQQLHDLQLHILYTKIAFSLDKPPAFGLDKPPSLEDFDKKLKESSYKKDEEWSNASKALAHINSDNTPFKLGPLPESSDDVRKASDEITRHIEAKNRQNSIDESTSKLRDDFNKQIANIQDLKTFKNRLQHLLDEYKSKVEPDLEEFLRSLIPGPRVQEEFEKYSLTFPAIYQTNSAPNSQNPPPPETLSTSIIVYLKKPEFTENSEFLFKSADQIANKMDFKKFSDLISSEPKKVQSESTKVKTGSLRTNANKNALESKHKFLWRSKVSSTDLLIPSQTEFTADKNDVIEGDLSQFKLKIDDFLAKIKDRKSEIRIFSKDNKFDKEFQPEESAEFKDKINELKKVKADAAKTLDKKKTELTDEQKKLEAYQDIFGQSLESKTAIFQSWVDFIKEKEDKNDHFDTVIKVQKWKDYKFDIIQKEIDKLQKTLIKGDEKHKKDDLNLAKALEKIKFTPSGGKEQNMLEIMKQQLPTIERICELSGQFEKAEEDFKDLPDPPENFNGFTIEIKTNDGGTITIQLTDN